MNPNKNWNTNVCHSNGLLHLLSAGEATLYHFYSTVHGTVGRVDRVRVVTGCCSNEILFSIQWSSCELDVEKYRYNPVKISQWDGSNPYVHTRSNSTTEWLQASSFLAVSSSRWLTGWHFDPNSAEGVNFVDLYLMLNDTSWRKTFKTNS